MQSNKQVVKVGRGILDQISKPIEYRELTTEDVKYTFERMFTPATGCTNTYMYNMITGAQDMLDGKATELSGFETVDDYTFK